MMVYLAAIRPGHGADHYQGEEECRLLDFSYVFDTRTMPYFREGCPLFIHYNRAQVLKLDRCKRYHDRSVIFYRKPRWAQFHRIPDWWEDTPVYGGGGGGGGFFKFFDGCRYSPRTRENEIRRLAERRKEGAMVGDGTQRCSALARALYGIAIGAGTDVAIESRHCFLMKSDLLNVYHANPLR